MQLERRRRSERKTKRTAQVWILDPKESREVAVAVCFWKMIPLWYDWGKLSDGIGFLWGKMAV